MSAPPPKPCPLQDRRRLGPSTRPRNEVHIHVHVHVNVNVNVLVLVQVYENRWKSCQPDRILTLTLIRSSTASIHRSSSGRIKLGESSRTTRNNATTVLPSNSNNNNKLFSSFVEPQAATSTQSLSRTSTSHRDILRSWNPSIRVSVANSQQTDDTWTTQQTMDGVADVGGFSKDWPRWKDRFEDQNALHRMVGYRQLAAPCTIASMAH